MAPPQVPFGAPMRHAHFAFSPDYLPLNHGSYGTHPVSVRAAHLALRAEVEAAPDPFIVYEFHDRLAKQRALTADLLKCPADELVFVPNATTGSDTVLKNLQWEKGDVVLCYEVIYGSVRLGLSWLTETEGVEVQTARAEFPLSDDSLVTSMVDAARKVNATEGKRVRLAIIDTIVSGPGMRVPFERLVPALQAEGALVLVDGAHGIGQIEIDLGELQPDFFVTNLHKWFFVPRGCAAFYVPKKHQPLIRTTLPTSHGFRPREPVAGDKGGSWIDMFDFTGTSDTTNWLCVEAAIKFRNQVCGGEASIQNYCISIARRAGTLVSEILGTDVLDSPSSCVRNCNFANVRLPLDIETVAAPKSVPEWLKKTAVRESGVYFQIFSYRGYYLWRLSGMIYLEEADYRKGAEILKDLCKRVENGEHVKESEERAPKEEGFRGVCNISIELPLLLATDAMAPHTTNSTSTNANSDKITNALLGIHGTRPSSLDERHCKDDQGWRDGSIGLEDEMPEAPRLLRETASSTVQHLRAGPHDSATSLLSPIALEELKLVDQNRHLRLDDEWLFLPREPSPLPSPLPPNHPLETYLRETSRHEQQALGIKTSWVSEASLKEPISRANCNAKGGTSSPSGVIRK